jgi:hypothetical protein
MKFRKKPIVIEAVQVKATDFNGHSWDGNPFSEALPEGHWLREAVMNGAVVPHTRGSTDYAEWDIRTLEGVMSAGPGDWIIRGVKGEIYPIKPDIFEETYEAEDAP